MFESSLKTALAGDSTLTGLLSTYGSPARPSIFSDQAPEKAKTPYIVFTISKYNTDAIAVDRFNVYIDFWDYGYSRADARAAAFEMEALLDQQNLTHARFNTIRLYRFSAGFIENVDDPRDIHYNLQLTARADRKGWMETL